MLESTADYLPPNLEQDVNHCIATHDVMRVSRLEGEPFMVISVEDWEAIEESLFLNSIPGFTESVHQAHKDILEGNGVPLEELDW